MRSDRNVIIPIAGMITAVFIVAIGNGAELLGTGSRVPEIFVGLVGLIGGGRYLMSYRHKLRMEEIEAQRAAELAGAEQLRAAERVLELDDRTEQLRSQLPAEPAPSSKTEQQEA